MPIIREDSESPIANEDPHPYLKRIVLQNFMCHENFEINLNKRLNLIYGTNGSGKSTILTAIMIALGSRAKATSRSTSVGSLVMTGKTRAWIHIKFHIPAAYRELHRKYGSEVTITRIINHKGTSEYQIRDESGRKVPKSGSRDVSLICYYFGIYPDNELAMLSQENAKEFLVHSSGQTKYQKLQRAMLQHIISRNQQAVEAAKTEHEKLLSEMKLHQENMELIETRAQEVLNRASEQRHQNERAKLIDNIIAWRRYDDAVDQRNNVQAMLRNEEGELSKLQQSSTEDSNGIQAELDQLADEHTKTTEAYEHISESLRSLEKDMSDLQYNARRSREDIDSCREVIEAFERDIASLEAKAASYSPENLKKQRETLERSIDDETAKKTEASNHSVDCEQKIENLNKTKKNISRTINDLNNESREVDNKMRSLRTELQKLTSGELQNNYKNPLHAKHNQLQQLVAQEKDWSEIPIGPIYKYLEMKDDGASYSPALERLWNSTLDCWWVQTDRDRNKLSRLATSIGFHNLRIILRRDDTFDFSSAMPSPSDQYKRALDLFNINLDAIKRILVDLNRIETMVMVSGTQNAFNAINVDKRIRNALALSITRHQKIQFTQVSAGLNRTDSATVQPNDLVRIRVGTKARCDHINSELNELGLRLSHIKDQMAEEKRSLERLDGEISLASRESRKYNNVVRQCEDHITEYLREIVSIDTDVGLAKYTSDIENLRTEMQQKLADSGESSEALAEMEISLTSIKDTIEAYRAEKSELYTRLHDIKKRTEYLQRRQHKIEADRAHLTRLIQRKTSTIRSLQADLRSHNSLVEEEKANAEENHGSRRSVNDANIDSLNQSLFNKDEKELSEEQRKLASQREVLAASEEEIRKAQEEAEKIADEKFRVELKIKEMEKLSRMTDTRRIEREENERRAWEVVKHKIATTFTETLQRRKFKGHVDINDSLEKLTIVARPEGNENNKVASLSGGEKSFTQVALLMSVWNTMQVGLVAMDEYDVFMDKANRSMSLRLLAETINRNEMQCILITPQDVDTSTLHDVEFNMHKLKPARR